MNNNLLIYQIARIWLNSPETIDYSHLGLEKDTNDIIDGLPNTIVYREVWENGTKKDVVKEYFTYTISNDIIVAITTQVEWYDLDDTIGYTKVFINDFSDLTKDANRGKIREVGIVKGRNLIRSAEMTAFFTLGEELAFEFFDLLTSNFVNKFVSRIKKDFSGILKFELIDRIENMTIGEFAYIEINVSDLIIANNSTATPPIKLRDYLITILDV